MTVSNRTDMVVYGSLEEQVLSLTLMVFLLVFAIIAQSSVIITIVKTLHLHNVHFYLLVSYCIADILAASMATPKLIVFYTSQASPECDSSVVLITLLLGTSLHTGLLSFERYIFFCKPLKYHRICTVKIITAAVFFCYASPFIFALVTHLKYERVFHASVLSCILRSVRNPTAIILPVFYIVPVTMTLFSICQIYKVAKRCMIDPATGNAAQYVNMKKQMQRALRMVALVSGAFWGLQVPGHMCRLIILGLGYTYEDLDTRRYFIPSILIRVSAICLTVIPVAVNPLIYYYSRKDLRKAFIKLFLPSRVESTDIIPMQNM